MTGPAPLPDNPTMQRFPSPPLGGERGGGQAFAFGKAEPWDA